MVSTRPVISKSFSSCTNPLVTIPRAPITIGITVTFMFHSFFQFTNKVEVLIFLFTFFQFYSCGQPEKQSPQFCKFPFLLIIIRSGSLAKIRGSVCISESQYYYYCYYHLTYWETYTLPHVTLDKQ